MGEIKTLGYYAVSYTHLDVYKRQMFMVFSVICVTGCLKAFDLVWAMTGGGPMDSSATPAVLLYTQGFQYKLMGRSGAISIILLVMGLGLSVLLNNVIFKERD